MDSLARDRARTQRGVRAVPGPHKSRAWALIDMERDHHVDGAPSRRHKELTATGISVAIDSESCMQHHIGRTIECGATLGGKP